MARNLKRVMYCVAIGVWLLGCVQAKAQAPADNAAISDLFNAARPHLEALLGRGLTPVPTLRIVDPDKLPAMPNADVDVDICRHVGNTDTQALDLARRVARDAAARATVACYAETDGVLYVIPANQATIAGWNEVLQPARAPAFLQLALVNEMARAALAERYQVGRKGTECRDTDELQVLQGLVQGRAGWVTLQVARRLGTEAYFPLLARRFLFVPDLAPDPWLRTVTQEALHRQHWACTQGLAFFTYLEEQGVKDAEERAFRQPPRQVLWIEQPQLYVRSLTQQRRALDTVLAGVAAAFPAAQWQSLQQSWTPEMVSQVAALLDARPRADVVLSTWDEGRSLVWTSRTNPGRQVALSVVRHQTVAGARSYYGFALDAQRKRDELSGSACSGPFQVLEAHSAAVSCRGVEEAVRFDKRVQFGAASGAVPAALVLCRAGDLVIEINWFGLEADMAWAQGVVGTVLAGASR